MHSSESKHLFQSPIFFFLIADICFPFPLKIIAIRDCVPSGLKQMLMSKNVYQRQMWINLPIPSHPFLERHTTFYTLLQMADGTVNVQRDGEWSTFNR